MLLTAGDCDVERQTIGVDHGVDFGRQPSAGASKFFAGAILSATRVLMGTDYRAVDHLHLSIVPMRDGSQDTIPDACATPTHEPFVAGGIGAVTLGQITPWCSRPQDPKDAVQDTPVIHTRDTSRLARKDWANQPPFGIGESVSHVKGSF
jgi:hypothetical protein